MSSLTINKDNKELRNCKMGVYIKTDNEAQYYLPTLVVDAATDRIDEIAVGSDGGSKGYTDNAGVQDTLLSVSVEEKSLMEVPQGFAFLLGSFSGIWAGAGQIKLKFKDTSNRILFQDFLTNSPLADYTYAVYLSIMDNKGNIVNGSTLSVKSTSYSTAASKYKSTFEVPLNEVTFGTTESGTQLKDLSKVYLYLRGFFYKGNNRHIEYIGGGIEMDSAGGDAAFRLRGFAGLAWQLSLPTPVTASEESGIFSEDEISFMPETDQLTLSVSSYKSAPIVLRGLLVSILKSNGDITDYIPISQKSDVEGALSVSMRTIRSKSPDKRSFSFKIFDESSHGWSIGEYPDWVTLTATSGESTTTITLTFAANEAGQARGGLIVLYDSTTNFRYQIPCVQWGVERFYAKESITSGEKKSVLAYAGTIAKNTFDLSVSYYNAASFNLYIRQVGFNIEDFAAKDNGLGTLNMKSGKCGGRSFNITKCDYDETNDRWKLTLDRLEDSSVGMVFPNLTFPIKAGDRFVLTDILMPRVYILAAEKRLLAKAKVYYDQHSQLKYLYDLEVDSKWVCKQNGVYLRPGMYMKIYDADLIGENPIYVLIDTVTITENESNISTYKVTLREKLYLPE